MQYYVIKNMEGGIQLHLNEPLWTSINKSRLFFPIHHANSNHYSLLIMDNKTRKFIHMNPLRPKKNVKNQVYHQNAKKIVRAVFYMSFKLQLLWKTQLSLLVVSLQDMWSCFVNSIFFIEVNKIHILLNRSLDLTQFSIKKCQNRSNISKSGSNL